MPIQTHLQEGELRIHHTPDLAARLFGLPFLLVGGYFLYYLVVILISYILEGDITAFLKGIPGLLLVIFMFLAFGVPGILLVLGSKRVRIDTGRMEVVDIQNYVVFKREQHYLTSDFQVVDVCYTYNRSRDSKERSRNYTTYDIYLAGRGNKSVFLATYSDKEQQTALAFGQQVATLMRVKLLNRTEGDEPTALSDEELMAI